MNAFADWLFSLMLGWTGALFNTIWSLFSNDSGGFIGFFRRFWWPAVLAILIGGTIMDYIIWLIRWRPHHAWRIWFLRSLSKRRLSAARNYMDQLDQAPLDLPAYHENEPLYFEPASGQDVPVLSPELIYTPARRFGDSQISQPVLWVQATHDQPSADRTDDVSRSIDPDLNAAAAVNPISPFSAQSQQENPALQEHQTQSPQHDDWLQRMYGNPQTVQTNPSVSAGENAFSGVETAEPGRLNTLVARRRRVDTRRQRQPGIFQIFRDNFLMQPENEQQMDSLPPPVSQEEAYHQPFYPENYRYREQTPRSLPDMPQRRDE